MEFPFNINYLFGDEISGINSSLTPFRITHDTARQRKEEVKKVIDKIGIASAKAQSLHGPVTSAAKLSNSHHHLYIKKDTQANKGNGTIIGFLKVGRKRLFIYDSDGIQHEMEPLCILDFYVHESCQRQGSGKQLFDCMLQQENVQPVGLAVDRPSAKCISFLARHYGLRSVIPQINNFVVYEGFFFKNSDAKLSRRPQMNKISDSQEKGQGSFHLFCQTQNNDGSQSCYIGNIQTQNDQFGEMGSVQARAEEVQDSSVLLSTNLSQTSGLPILRPSSGQSLSLNQLNGEGAGGSTQSRPFSQQQQQALGMMAQQAMYSRHQMSSPLATDDRNTAKNILQYSNRVSSPPLLQRGGPPLEYLKIIGNSNYLDRRGHLRIGLISPSLPDQPNLCEANELRSLRQRQQDTTFNIFGIPKVPIKPVNTTSYQRSPW